MPKKARSAAEKRKFAEEKGYVGDINTVNNKIVSREILPYTRGQYRVFLDLWDEWVTADEAADETY